MIHRLKSQSTHPGVKIIFEKSFCKMSASLILGLIKICSVLSAVKILYPNSYGLNLTCVSFMNVLQQMTYVHCTYGI